MNIQSRIEYKLRKYEANNDRKFSEIAPDIYRELEIGHQDRPNKFSPNKNDRNML